MACDAAQLFFVDDFPIFVKSPGLSPTVFGIETLAGGDLAAFEVGVIAFREFLRKHYRREDE